MATLIQPEASNITAPTQFVASRLETYAYRRFGRGSAPPLLGLQHFTGTLDFWDPAVTDPIARGREVILFENAGLGRSSGEVPDTMAAWRHTSSRSWMRSVSSRWTSSASPSAACSLN